MKYRSDFDCWHSVLVVAASDDDAVFKAIRLYPNFVQYRTLGVMY